VNRLLIRPNNNATTYSARRLHASSNIEHALNHPVEQWGAAFLQLYPQAKLFVATKDHFATGMRQA
jgi:N12 class adenine-specific DNA methylase